MADDLAGMDDEGVRRLLGELLASNRKTQENLDEIRQQFPIQPGNLSDLIPDWAELEEGGLFPPEGEEPEFADGLLPFENKGDLLVSDEDGNVGVLPAGKPGQLLTVDPSAPLGLSWGGETTDTPGANNGEELTAELAQWITVHENVQSVPDDNEATIETSYTPPAKCELLCVIWFRHHSGFAKPVLLNGAGEEVAAANDHSIQLSGGGLGGTQMGVMIWKDPPAGTIKVTLNSSTQDYTFLPISVKGQGGEHLQSDGAPSSKYSQGEDKDLSETINLTFPGLYIHFALRDGANEAPPAASTSRDGVRLLNLVNDTAGQEEDQRVEVAAELAGSGGSDVEYHFKEATSGGTGSSHMAVEICEEPA